MIINNKLGHLQDWITQVWVKATGNKFDPEKETWLIGPIGDIKIIKDQFIKDIAQKDDLEISNDVANAGLLESFDDLELTEEEGALLNPAVVQFYENTSNYNF